VKRFHQFLLIASTLVACWLGMQQVHETGHVLAGLITGAEVQKVVLNPTSISRTDLGANPHPLLVVWAGPVFGSAFPLSILIICIWRKLTFTFVIRFFAGFCCIANGAYIAYGVFDAIGDAGDMLRYGSSVWQLLLFGAVTIPIGFWLWNGQGKFFGLGTANGNVDARITYGTLVVALMLVVVGFVVDGK
jgi:hypothetical protein